MVNHDIYVFHRDIGGTFLYSEKGGGVKTRSLGPRQRPTWLRGPAHLKEDEIVLDETRAEEYAYFEPEQLEGMLMELGELRLMGSIKPLRVEEPQRAVPFARRHGLLWHGPAEAGSGKCRESLKSWLIAGHELSLSIALYMSLEKSIKAESAKPLRQFLLPLRDLGGFWGAMPEDTVEFQEGISVLLAERINTGMKGSNQTFVAACGLERGGVKAGSAGDFRYSVDPTDLVAAAYNELASLIVSKARFEECAGCGTLFRSEHGNQSYCSSGCSGRARKRKQRADKSETA